VRLSPKKVIYLAVSNYLSPDEAKMLLAELAEKDGRHDNTFLKITGKYFDFSLLKDKPYIKEDILIYNYLMYQLKPKKTLDLFTKPQQITMSGKFPRTGLIVRYENRVILPQLHLMEEAYKLIKGFN
jgi:hypothetical protein